MPTCNDLIFPNGCTSAITSCDTHQACQLQQEPEEAHAAVPKVLVEMWVELCSMTRDSPKSASLQV